MNPWKTFLSALALTTLSLFALSALAQDPGQAPPPRVVGAVQVDQLTQAPLQIVRSISLDAAPEEVFRFVTDHSKWPGLLSAVESVSVSGNGRTGSTRSFALTGGAKIAERIVAYNEPGADGTGTFAYSVSPDNPFGVQGHLAVLELRPADDGGTVLNYHQIFDHPDLNAIAPAIAQGTDEIVGNILYRFGGELRGRSEGTENVTIELHRVVDVSSRRAWKVIGEMWGDVDAWASVISHSTVNGGHGSTLKGATRSCEVPGTPGFRETMTAYDEDQLTLTYRVLEGVPPFVTNAENTWTLRPITKKRVVVTSRVSLQIAPGTPSMAVGMVKGQFTQLLDLTADELEHFMETNRPHPRKVAAQRMASSSRSRR